MATIKFSTLANNQTITFDPATDVLRFDNIRIGAGSVLFNYSPTLDTISLTARVVY